MDALKILTELRQERDNLAQAIMAIERLATPGSGKRRGRPPAWMKKAVPVAERATRKKTDVAV